MPNVTLPRADIPIDSAGNVASRDLYRWMSDMTNRVGGTTGQNPGGQAPEAIAISALRRSIPDQPTPQIDLQRSMQTPPRVVNDSEVFVSRTTRTAAQRTVDESSAILALRVFGRRA